MGIRVWLDDVRDMPKGFDLWVRNAYAMAGVLNFQDVDYISFDHDLGDEKHGNTGYATALLIELWAHDKKITKPIGWDVHSANPVGRKNIEAAMLSAERFWSINETNS